MDTIPTNPPVCPYYLRVGQYVRVAEWIGQIVDIAISERGRVMVLVQSPKMTWRNGGVEWLEYLADRPNLIQPATQIDYLTEVELYLRRCEHTSLRLSNLYTEHGMALVQVESPIP